MKTLLITLALITCSAESCQKEAQAAAVHNAVAAPEIDAGSSIAALTLLIGALIVLRNRK
jgi:hypothetical protein